MTDLRGGNNPEVSFNTPSALSSPAQTLLASFAVWITLVAGGGGVFKDGDKLACKGEVTLVADRGGIDKTAPCWDVLEVMGTGSFSDVSSGGAV
jgi:hypothetical protein